MHAVTILCGAAAGVATILACFSPEKDRDDATFFGVVLVAAWAVTGQAWLMNSLEKLAAMDGAILALSLSVLWPRPSLWRLWFFDMALAQLGLDMLYNAKGPGFYTPYQVFYNLTFAGEVVAVAWGGGRNALDLARTKLRRICHVLPSKLVQGRKVGG